MKTKFQTLNKLRSLRVLLLCACIACGMSLRAELSPVERRFAAEYFERARQCFCGNSPGVDYAGIMRRHGISDVQMRRILRDVASECLDIAPPRGSVTNAICAAAIRMMIRFHDPESVTVAKQAYFDESEKFKTESRFALFACVTNVSEVTGFVARVWQSASSRVSSDRISTLLAVNKWVRAQTNQIEGVKSSLYDGLSLIVPGETNSTVAIHLDKTMAGLSMLYSDSPLRTNLVLRFMTDHTSRMDPEYFSRLADEMHLPR